MAISDLLSRVSKRRPASSRSAFKPRGPERRVTPGTAPYGGQERRAQAERRAPVPVSGGPRPPLPSHAIAIISGLSILCLALAAALVASLDARPADDDLAATVQVSDAEPAPEAPAQAFVSEARTIPTSLLTRLEAATDAPLESELRILLEAVQIGFGDSSVQLEPTLRTYAYRTSSRFVWEPDSFTVTVQAPDPELAAARASTLSRLFETALDEGRLQFETATGPHALSLASR